MAKYDETRVVKAIIKYRGHITNIAKACGVSRHGFYDWLEKYPVVAEALADIKETILDEAEQALEVKATSGSLGALKFLLENKGKDRGYSNTQNLNVQQNAPLEINFNEVTERKPIDDAT